MFDRLVILQNSAFQTYFASVEQKCFITTIILAIFFTLISAGRGLSTFIPTSETSPHTQITSGNTIQLVQVTPCKINQCTTAYK